MRLPRKVLAWLAAAALPLFAGGLATVPAVASGPSTWVVTPHGSDTNACTASAPCATIGHAVSVAHRHDIVLVRHGTYHEDVTISKGVRVIGDDWPTVDATGFANGFLITGAAASDAVVRGFRVMNATDEGILAQNTRDIAIRNNNVSHNDLGIFLPPSQQTGECAAVGLIPGDCGEGVHLWSVRGSEVTGNRVTGNSGGILLTDETGPTAGNLVGWNTVLDNLFDCGITVAGHNPMAAPGGVPAASVAGIYDNTIEGNTVNGNGVKGQGAGILLAGGAPGTAVYDNLVLDNVASGNGLSGVTVHSHAPGQDLNGNRIIGNWLSNDNLDGDMDFAPFVDTKTTGVLIASATPLIAVVRDNHLSDVYYGIWTLNASTIKKGANHFAHDVVVPLLQQ